MKLFFKKIGRCLHFNEAIKWVSVLLKIKKKIKLRSVGVEEKLEKIEGQNGSWIWSYIYGWMHMKVSRIKELDTCTKWELQKEQTGIPRNCSFKIYTVIT